MKTLKCLDKAASRLADTVYTIKKRFLGLSQRTISFRGTSSRRRSDTPSANSIEEQKPLPQESPWRPEDEVCHPDHKPISGNFNPPKFLPPLDNPPNSSSEGFPRFRDLPAEIRIMIWQQAARVPRVIEMPWQNDWESYRRSTAPRPPALLHVCFESRYESLKIYELYRSPKDNEIGVFINPELDVLFFRSKPYTLSFRNPLRSRRPSWPKSLLNVRRIAFLSGPVNFVNVGRIRRAIPMFQNLEEVILLWAEDAATRPMEGRGTNFIEELPLRETYTKMTAWKAGMDWRKLVLDRWESDKTWAKLGRKSPVITVRHWCRRTELEW